MKQNDKTMQEIADEVGVSKQTVFRCIKNNKIKETGKIGNAFLYDPTTVSKIMELLGVEKQEQKIKENHCNNQEELETEIKRLRKAQEDLHREFAQEREEIRSNYREQLYSKDKQIDDLHKLLDQQQQLALVNHNKIEVLELELQEQEKRADKEQEQSKKRSIFNIFKKD